MIIEFIPKTKIAFMRQIGEYGVNNKVLMDKFKDWIEKNKLDNKDNIILGIALDNPNDIPSSDLRYDVCLIIDEDLILTDISIRYLEATSYAIFEIEHTTEAVKAFWKNIEDKLPNSVIDFNKPVIERYSVNKIKQGLCEFCLPLKNNL